MNANKILAVTDLIRANVNNGESLPVDWAMNEDDLKIIDMIFDDKQPANTDDEAEVLQEFVRLDSKTHRVMIAGMMIFGGEAYFVDTDDAVEYLNANGVECDTFGEAYELSEAGEIDETFYTEWYEPSYS